MTEDKNKRLSALQKAFAEHYVENGLRNQTEAAVKAGYAASSASTRAGELVKNRFVLAYINELMLAKHEGKNPVDEMLRRRRKAEELLERMVDGEEKDQFGLELQAKDRIAAARELIRIDEASKKLADNAAAAAASVQLVITPTYGLPTDGADIDAEEAN